jgi:formylmethanofuran dehydrogenase subunit A
MKRSGYGREQIDEALMKATFTVPEGELAPPPVVETSAWDEPSVDMSFSAQVEEDMISDLTDEDRRYLCLKWGKTYRPDEWIRLEELYE